VLGGIQPGVLKNILRGKDDDGLNARFECIYIERRKRIDRDMNRQAGAAWFSAIKWLANEYQRNPDQNRNIVLSEDAQAYREEVEWRVEAMLNFVSELPACMDSAVAKWTAEFAQLCLVFHMLECASAGYTKDIYEISGNTAERARNWLLRVLLPNTLRHYHEQYGTDETDAKWIAEHILAHEEEYGTNYTITARDLRRARDKTKDQWPNDEIIDAMAVLEAMNWTNPVDARQNSTKWAIHADVFNVFAELADQAKQSRAKRSEQIIRDKKAWKEREI
jgi:hypothetical protein